MLPGAAPPVREPQAVPVDFDVPAQANTLHSANKVTLWFLKPRIKALLSYVIYTVPDGTCTYFSLSVLLFVSQFIPLDFPHYFLSLHFLRTIRNLLSSFTETDF